MQDRIKELDCISRTVTFHLGEKIRLTPDEFSLLLLLRTENRYFERHEILKRLGNEHRTLRLVDVLKLRLVKKIGALISCKAGYGYRYIGFNDDTQD